jgi:hypothetical protein
MPDAIASFLRDVQKHLNRSQLRRGAVSAVIILAAACIVWALVWRIFGYAAPLIGYAAGACVTLLCGIVLFRIKRHILHTTAMKADGHFHLKDALISFLDFHQRSEHDAEVYRLQQESVARSIAPHQASSIAQIVPRRRLGICAALVLLAIGLALLPHSAAVRQKIDQENLTLSRTEQIQKEMHEVVEEIIAAMDEKEKELLSPEKLREWVKDLDGTKDQREAMKKLAKFEQKISEAMKGMEARKDEEILKLAAAELDASKMADAKQLAKKLEAKDFENAKQQLSDLKKEMPKDLKKMTPEEMKKLLENSAKMKEMSQRMANGARKRDFGKQAKAGQNGKNMKAADGENGEEAQEMDQLLQDLEDAAAGVEEEMEELEEGDDMEAGEAMEKLDQELDKLGRRLGKLGAKQKARSRMKALGKCAGKCQKFATGQSQQLGLGQVQSQQPGGLKPGTGHSDAKRKEKDERKDNGNLTQLQGQQGEGPSSSSVEQADSGEGVSGRAGSDKNRDFRKQTESLVQRDDVPEELKQGIREYFNRVHEIETKE